MHLCKNSISHKIIMSDVYIEDILTLSVIMVFHEKKLTKPCMTDGTLGDFVGGEADEGCQSHPSDCGHWRRSK